MLVDSLDTALKGTGPALGAYTNDPDMVELMGYMGFDFVMIDQMFTGNDWNKTEILIRTAEAAAITPIVRVQSNPWLGYDPRIAVDVARAAGIGANYIFVSNSCAKEIQDCATVSHDWHRKAMHIHPFESMDEWEDRQGALKTPVSIIPTPETKQAIDEVEETLNIPEVNIMHFAMTDASRVLTDSTRPDWYSPKVWDMFDNAVRIGKTTNTYVGGNTSYTYDMNEMHKRVLHLNEHGAKIILVQGAPYLFQLAIGEFMKNLRKELP